MTYRRRISAAVIAAACALSLSGCFQGFNAMTSTQGPGGVGVSTTAGEVQIRSLSWVRSAQEPNSYTLVGTFVNTGVTDDALVSFTTVPDAFAEAISDGKIVVPGRNGEVRVGFESDKFVTAFGVTVPPSSFIPTTLNFQSGGSVTVPILTQEPAGAFAGVVVPLPSASPSASGSPKAPASPSASAPASPSS